MATPQVDQGRSRVRIVTSFSPKPFGPKLSKIWPPQIGVCESPCLSQPSGAEGFAKGLRFGMVAEWADRDGFSLGAVGFRLPTTHCAVRRIRPRPCQPLCVYLFSRTFFLFSLSLSVSVAVLTLTSLCPSPRSHSSIDQNILHHSRTQCHPLTCIQTYMQT